MPAIAAEVDDYVPMPEMERRQGHRRPLGMREPYGSDTSQRSSLTRVMLNALYSQCDFRSNSTYLEILRAPVRIPRIERMAVDTAQ